MQPIAMTRGTVLVPVYEASRYVNVPLQQLARKRKLPYWEIDDPDTWVPTNSVVMLASDIRAIVGPEVYGIWLEQACGLSALGPLGDVLRRSRTLGDALSRYFRFYRQFRTYAKLSSVQRGGDLWIRRSADPGSQGDREVLQLYALSEIIKIVGLATGDQWTPQKIVLGSNADSILQTMPHLAGANASVGADFCAIAIPTSLLSLPMPRSGESGIDSAMHNGPDWSQPPDCFTDCVSEVISTQFSGGYPDIDLVAESIGLNARTFQRRLAADGVSYRELVDRYRYQLAKRLLTEGKLGCTEVAFELGYNEAGSFSRAFLRWAGVSPRQYQASHTLQ